MTRPLSKGKEASVRERPVAAGLALMSMILASCAEQADPITLPNPAAAFCESEGGSYEIRQGEEGARGFCILADGTEIDAWDYFRARGAE